MSIRSWLGLCDHKWAITERGRWNMVYEHGDVPHGYIHWTILQCEKCGKMKREKVRT